MRRWHRILRATLPVLLLAAGCDDYLEGPGLNEDPNRPTEASRDQLLVAVQVSQFALQTGHLARVASMWVQQMAGTDRQYQSLDRYDVTEADFAPQFNDVYTGGGLIDLRRIQASALEDGDRIYAGVAKVWEAFIIGMAASVWGDIPYSEAVNDQISTPRLDEQRDVYDAVQALLDDAIADLQSGEGAGPGSVDMIYNGDPQKWIELAHTLKARFHLHWAEVDPASYGLALAEAQQGISAPENDFRTVHSSDAGEQNLWYQFFRDRDTYMRAGAFLVDLLKSRNDPRLQEYFARNQAGEFVGAAPGEGVQGTHSLLSAERSSPQFRQPLVTWAENQLIIAEAALNTGDTGLAQSALDAVRQSVGLGSVPATLESIMTEKYIVMFQNIEAWNDYKRTCIPALTPAASRPAIPGRLLYGEDERNANPNIPAPAQQPARNDNDPRPCA